ncbi:SDR family NAD(P)-dependent oxidoreductase [Billgrantia pellis]|uniref:SDR family NAD(P)-dependent oxidoreductase n=1 Tax=Billgrantia pellis TaxID=2606936 RepID=UPI001E30F312|nr:SDR family NAD(P)-dependent oxidoreductase [Halomonas pellis]
MSKRVLVTGGARGIGRIIATRLAREGWSVVVADLDAEGASESASELPGSQHEGLQVDISDEQQVSELFDEAERQAPLNALVCNAGLLILRKDGNRSPITEMPLAEFQKTSEVNLTGTFLTIREFLRRRQRAGAESGRIVTFSSSAAQLGGYRSSAAYIAAKSGILGLTKAAAREAASMGITVNAVAPGSIDAPMLRLSLKEGDERQAASGIPLGRLGTPEDVAGAVAFLVSEDAAYITGAVIDINGGVRMQ